MKTIWKAFLATAALASVSLNSQAAVATVGSPRYYNGHNYYLIGQGSWSASEAFAQSMNGHLVTINDAAENAWLTTNFLLPNPTMNPWMGLNDADNNGSWLWSSGESVSYLNWAPGEPNFSWELHGNIYENTAGPSLVGKWNNAPGDTTLYGIVEVPEPATMSIVLLAALGCAAQKLNRK
ncbi:MAG: C-type lectin domain-containing protein [Verrucomicrobiota bacterium]